MVRLLVKILVVALAIGLTAALMPGIEIDGAFGTLVWVATLFTLVNILLKPVVQVLSLPLLIISLGLFAFVINAGLLLFTAWLTEGLEIDGFWPAVWGSILISLVLAVAEAVLAPD
ncbi:MAG TPA: phage holin family protein [Iamia sp.]